jgi:hypothetical protein
MTLFLAPAPDCQTLRPFSTQSCPSLCAEVRIAPTSEPASGSEIPIENLISPLINREIHFFFCSSVPLRATVNPQKSAPA